MRLAESTCSLFVSAPRVSPFDRHAYDISGNKKHVNNSNLLAISNDIHINLFDESAQTKDDAMTNSSITKRQHRWLAGASNDRRR